MDRMKFPPAQRPQQRSQQRSQQGSQPPSQQRSQQRLQQASRARPDPSDVIECVLDCVCQVPAGSVSTYGDVGEQARALSGGGGARQVGHILSKHGAGVPWWRIVNASGWPPLHKREEAAQRLREEGVAFLPGTDRVDLVRSRHVFSPPGAAGWTHA